MFWGIERRLTDRGKEAIRRWGLFLVVVMALVGALRLGFASFSRRIIYPIPSPVTEFDPAPFERVVLPEEAGAVNALYLPAKPGQRVLAVFHGNGDQLSRLLPSMAAFTERGFGALLIEYPGYGLSREGSPSEPELYHHADRVLSHLRSARNLQAEDVVLVGESLGSGVAVEMAKRGFGSRLVLLSPFTSLPEVASFHMPWGPVQWLEDKYENLRKAPDIALPTLILHGTKDRVIPVHMGEALSRAFPNARFVPCSGLPHGHFLGRYRHRVLQELLRAGEP